MSVLLVKQRISTSGPPFGVWGGLYRGNVCDSSLARWKARIRLSLGIIIEHFTLAITTEPLRH